MNDNLTLWKGNIFKEVNRQEIIERLKKESLKYQKTNIEFSTLIKDIIDRIECLKTVQIYSDGTIRIFYEDSIYSHQKVPSDFIKGQNALLLSEILFSDEEKNSENTKKMMERKNGFFVLLGNNEDIKFEGIIACMHDSLDETIQIKKGFYDNSNGEYVQKDLLIVDYLKGTGIVELKEFLTKIATEKLNCGIQMPELAITQEAMDFIEK